jgi:hypothetical protein
VLAALVSAFPEPPYPRELFPELARQRPYNRGRRAVAASALPQPVPAATGAITDEQVAAWTRSLFPETAAAGRGRVTTDLRERRSA